VVAKLERPKSLRDFQQMNIHIYGKKNREKYRDEELVARLIEEISVLMEHARKDMRQRFRLQLANIFSWYNAVANRLGLGLQEILWNKYPGVCSYCMRDRDCMCGTEHPVQIENKEFVLRGLRLDREGREPTTLSEHQAFHARLYAWQHDRELPIVIAAHLVEEAGETSAAFRHKDREGLSDEMADICSWIFALATRMEFDLADAVWEYYPYACVKCHAPQCICSVSI